MTILIRVIPACLNVTLFWTMYRHYVLDTLEGQCPIRKYASSAVFLLVEMYIRLLLGVIRAALYEYACFLLAGLPDFTGTTVLSCSISRGSRCPPRDKLS